MPLPENQLRLGILAVLRPGARLLGDVACTVECALHEIVFGGLTSRRGRQRGGCRFRSSDLGYGTLRRGMPLTLLLAPEKKPQAGNYQNDHERTHILFRSSYRASASQAKGSLDFCLLNFSLIGPFQSAFRTNGQERIFSRQEENAPTYR